MSPSRNRPDGFCRDWSLPVSAETGRSRFTSGPWVTLRCAARDSDGRRTRSPCVQENDDATGRGVGEAAGIRRGTVWRACQATTSRALSPRFWQSRPVWQAVDAMLNQRLRLAVRATLRDGLPASKPFLWRRDALRARKGPWFFSDRQAASHTAQSFSVTLSIHASPSLIESVV